MLHAKNARLDIESPDFQNRFMLQVSPQTVFATFWELTSLNVFLKNDGGSFFAYARSTSLGKLIGFPVALSSREEF